MTQTNRRATDVNAINRCVPFLVFCGWARITIPNSSSWLWLSVDACACLCVYTFMKLYSSYAALRSTLSNHWFIHSVWHLNFYVWLCMQTMQLEYNKNGSSSSSCVFLFLFFYFIINVLFHHHHHHYDHQWLMLSCVCVFSLLQMLLSPFASPVRVSERV